MKVKVLYCNPKLRAFGRKHVGNQCKGEVGENMLSENRRIDENRNRCRKTAEENM